MSRERLRVLSTVGIVLAVVLIAFATLTPSEGGGGCPLRLPCEAIHFGLFALLGVPVALRFAVSDVARRSPRRALGMLFTAIWIFAAATELGQEYVDGREPDFADWVADMLGAVAGLATGSVGLRALLQRD